MRGEVIEDRLERDPTGAALRAIPLKIDPALVETIDHAGAGERMLLLSSGRGLPPRLALFGTSLLRRRMSASGIK